MNNVTKIIIAIVSVVILAGGAVLILGANKSGAPDQGTPGTSQSAELTINYTDNGFEPTSATVAAGKTVKITNQSKAVLDFASATHPVHDKNSEFNLGEIAPGNSKTFKPTQKGAWGFHDHYQPTHTGKLTVE